MSGYLGRDAVFWQMGQRESPELLETIRALENVDFQDDEGTSYLHIAARGHKLEALIVRTREAGSRSCTRWAEGTRGTPRSCGCFWNTVWTWSSKRGTA